MRRLRTNKYAHPRARTEYVGGSDIKIIWPCGHWRIETQMVGPKGPGSARLRKPMSPELLKRMAAYWGRSGLIAGPCPTCKGVKRRSCSASYVVYSADLNGRAVQVNAQQRKAISRIISTLEGLQAEVEALQQEEQDKFDNLSEGLQQSENGQATEQAASSLDEAATSIGSAIDSLSEATGGQD